MQFIEDKTAIDDLKTVRDMVRFGASQFNLANLFYGHGTDNAWDEAAALVLYALNLSADFGNKIIESRLTIREKRKILDLYQIRIINRLPVPYITHQCWFAGLSFYVDKDVLIPRSPIAELIENYFQPWIDADRVEYILDIGTGSACLACAAAYHFPNAKVDAIDIDPKALAVAYKNRSNLQLDDEVELIESDLFEKLAGRTYDIIIANPPYVDAEDMNTLPAEYLHEPVHALAAGEDGLDFAHRIIAEAKEHMTAGAILILEVGNSSNALELAYPKLEFTWLEFEHGGDGICLIKQEQL